VALLLPLMGFLFISLLITAIGMSLLRGETAIERRLGELSLPGSLPAVPAAGNERLLNTLRRLGRAAPKPSRELGKLKERLIHAGYRGSEALTLFFGIRLGLAIVLFLLGTSPFIPKSGLIAGLAGAAFGYLLPSMALARMAKSPRHEEFSCPTCHEAPPQGDFWRCTKCGEIWHDSRRDVSRHGGDRWR